MFSIVFTLLYDYKTLVGQITSILSHIKPTKLIDFYK